MGTILLDASGGGAGLGEAHLLLNPIIEEEQLDIFRLVGLIGNDEEWGNLIEKTISTLYARGRYGSEWQLIVLVDLYPIMDDAEPVRIKRQLDIVRNCFLKPMADRFSVKPRWVHMLVSNAHDRIEVRQDEIGAARDLDFLGYSPAGNARNVVTHEDLQIIDESFVLGPQPDVHVQKDLALSEQDEGFKRWFKSALDESIGQCKKVFDRCSGPEYSEDDSFFEGGSVESLAEKIPMIIKDEFERRAGKAIGELYSNGGMFLPSEVVKQELRKRFTAVAKLRGLRNVTVMVFDCHGHEIRKRIQAACMVIVMAELTAAMKDKIREERATNGLFDLSVGVDEEKLVRLMRLLSSYYKRNAEQQGTPEIVYEYREASGKFCDVELGPVPGNFPRLHVSKFNVGVKEEKLNFSNWSSRLQERIEKSGFDATIKEVLSVREEQRKRSPQLQKGTICDDEKRRNLEASLKDTIRAIELDWEVLKKIKVERDWSWKERILFPVQRQYIARRARFASRRQARLITFILGAIFFTVALTPPLADGSAPNVPELLGLTFPLILFLLAIYFTGRVHKARVERVRLDAERPLRKFMQATLERFRKVLGDRIRLLCRIFWNRNKASRLSTALQAYRDEERRLEKQAVLFRGNASRAQDMVGQLGEGDEQTAMEASALRADLLGWRVWERLLGDLRHSVDVIALGQNRVEEHDPQLLPLLFLKVELKRPRIAGAGDWER